MAGLAVLARMDVGDFRHSNIGQTDFLRLSSNGVIRFNWFRLRILELDGAIDCAPLEASKRLTGVLLPFTPLQELRIEARNGQGCLRSLFAPPFRFTFFNVCVSEFFIADDSDSFISDF